MIPIRSFLRCLALLTASSVAWASDGNTTVTSDAIVCPAYPDECKSQLCQGTSESSVDPLRIRILILNGIYPTIYNMVNLNAVDFQSETGANIELELVRSETYQDFYREIVSDAKNGGGLFDGYLTNNIILGEVEPYGGLFDLKPYINEDRNIDWTDVLPPFRKWVASYGDKVYQMPLDGDKIAMYCRKDALDALGLAVPRTWEEYLNVAKAVHGKEYKGKVLNGNCFATGGGGLLHFSIQLILASMTQSQGTSTGSLFDTDDMKPLLGEAFTETLAWMEEILLYSTDDVFDLNPYVPLANLNDGTCMLTWFWGDEMKLSGQDSYLKQNGKLGVARVPCSTKVLDRESGKLVDCTAELCKYGEFYEDIGWVNYSPYIASGGHGLAISANTSEEKKKALVQFLLFAGKGGQSDKYVIQNSTADPSSYTAQDPFRKSHLIPDKWVAQGYDAGLAKEYTQVLLKDALSKNIDSDIRFPKSADIYSIFSEQILQHLNTYQQEADLEKERLRIAQVIADQWTDTISTYNNLGDTTRPILEAYQVERGVYVPSVNKNQINNIIPVGFVLMSIILASSIGFGIWTFKHTKTKVVKASQPPFLYLICVGCAIMALSIVPMSVDDSMADEKGCSIACASTPWLVFIGFGVTFSALFSKIWRLNILFKSAHSFKRITVTAKDVMLPFCSLFVVNVALLLTWTLTDPLQWERTVTGRGADGSIESVGGCVSNGEPVSVAMATLLFVVNILALLVAIAEAYKARNISIEFSESHYIGMAMLFILEGFLIGVPLIFLTGTSPVAGYFVQTVLVFLVSMSILLFIFGPKIYFVKNPEANNVNASASVVSSATGIRTNVASIRASAVSSATGIPANTSLPVAESNANTNDSVERNELLSSVIEVETGDSHTEGSGEA